MSDSFRIPAANITRPDSKSPFLLICEHASNAIPSRYQQLGLAPELLDKHIAYDPGAIELASLLSELLNATLIYSGVSRLVYDCNRPPDATDAMPTKSEIYDIPGNKQLSSTEKRDRIALCYEPFRRLVAETIASRQTDTAIVTVHSFTPNYNGQVRNVELGILHDTDARLADKILADASNVTGLNTQRNRPYGPEDGVTHTLKLHGINNQLLNVMLEVRNDKLSNNKQQIKLAESLAELLPVALAACQSEEIKGTSV